MVNRKPASRNGRKPGSRQKVDPIKRDIKAIVAVAISVLLFLSACGLLGAVGQGIGNVMFGLFGWGSFLLPFLIVFVSIYLLFKKIKLQDKLRIAWVILLFVFICAFMQLVQSGADILTPDKEFIQCMEGHVGGGFFGSCFAYAFQAAFGLGGAYFICILAFIILALLILRISPVDLIRSRMKEREEEIPRRRRRDMEERVRRPERSQRKERQKEESPIDSEEDLYPEEPVPAALRKDNKVRGISFETITSTDAPPVPLTPDFDEVKDEVPFEDGEILDIHSHVGDPSVNHIALDPVGEIKETEPMPKLEPEPISALEPEPVFVPEPQPVFEPEPEPEPVIEIIPEPELEPIAEPEPVIEPVIEPVVEPEPILEAVAEIEPEPCEEKHLIEIADVREEPIEEYRPGPAIEIVPDASFDPEPELVAVHEPIPEPEPIPVVVPQEVPSLSIEPQEEAKDETEEIEAEPKYVFPPIDLLKPAPGSGATSKQDMQATADKLVETLKNFGVEVTINDISVGPAVTRFELIPQTGVKVAKIINLSDDIKLNLAAADIRIEAPIPGKSAVGIEVPNKSVRMVSLRELIESQAFSESSSNVAFGAGMDIGGNIIVSDIAKMPHVLIAGATGSGKSVCINTIIMSILYRADPKDVKFIMIDPKVVELSVYNGIPHLMVPVVSDPKKAAAALNWAVHEMNDRYQKFAELGVRDMSGYNRRVESGIPDDEDGRHKRLPQIIVIVDELADLMMVSSSEVEESICRLAQLARAAGIHLVIATQRPSVNVITGLIKANMPSRIAFAVTSGVDSRTILDMNGAEKLLGKGDMLYFPQGLPKPIRVQGAFVSDDEVFDVASFIREHNQADTDEHISRSIEEAASAAGGQSSVGVQENYEESRDAYFEAAGRFIIEKEKASIGLLQRNFKIGFNRAARIMDQLGEAGVVGPEEGTKPRKILVSLEEFEDILKKEI